jgi:phage terminase large subunit
LSFVININKKGFLPVYRPYIEDYESRYQVYYGGRGSGKTIFAMDKLVIKGLKEKRMILLMRKTTASCKFSVWKELKEAVERMKLTKYFTFYESDYSAVCSLTGTMFKCTGLDIAEKIKGFSEISDVLLEEATEFTPEDFELIDGTVRSVKYLLPLNVILLFNPVSKANWVYKRFGFDTNITPENTFILKTTYLDNPYLSEDYIQRMENMRLTNPARWKIEALGDFVSLDKLIFNNWKIEEFNHAAIKGDLLVGMDFGFVNDLSTIVSSVLDEENKRIYIFKTWGATNKTNEELAAIISSLGFSKSTIVADSAEQKSIEEIRRKGVVKIKPAVKGPDSIIHGIQKLQNYEIIVHPSCDGIITEFENYSWVKDKASGEYINKPIDDFNHYIDALRYSLQCADKAQKLKTLNKSALSL